MSKLPLTKWGAPLGAPRGPRSPLRVLEHYRAVLAYEERALAALQAQDSLPPRDRITAWQKLWAAMDARIAAIAQIRARIAEIEQLPLDLNGGK